MEKIKITFIYSLIAIVIGWSAAELYFVANPKPFIALMVIILITLVINIKKMSWLKFEKHLPKPGRKIVVRDDQKEEYESILYIKRNHKYIAVPDELKMATERNGKKWIQTGYHININPFIDWKYKS
jgi:hypothetical protein